MFSDRNKYKLKFSIFLLNVSVLNLLSVQPAQAIYAQSEYTTLVSGNVVISTTSAAETALAAINAGTEIFADFATAGVKNSVAGNKVSYDTAIAHAITTKGSSLTLQEVQTQIAVVNYVAGKNALAAINAGTEIFADFATAGLTNSAAGNKAAYDAAIASAIKTKGSSLTLPEVQTQITVVNAAVAAAAKTALAAINAGTEIFADFATAGLTNAVPGNKVGYDTNIATAKTTRGASLTLKEVQTQINVFNAAAALTAINRGTEIFADFATAGVKNAVSGSKSAYDTAILNAIKAKGSSLTLPEVQTKIDVVNSAVAKTALEKINIGTKVFDYFATAGVKYAVAGNKAAYDSAILNAVRSKGSSLTLPEVQIEVNVVNAAAVTAAKAALAAINAGTEIFADFATAGVKNAVPGNNAAYDTAIATAIQTKGSSLTLAEVQQPIDVINATASLAAINERIEVFADFATAGVKNAVVGNKAAYDTAIVNATRTKGSGLTLPEVQQQIDIVNAATASNALEAINRGTEVFADFATAGLTNAIAGNKTGYDTAIATAVNTKAAHLTLAEVQAQIGLVNAAAAAAAKTALAAINGGTEVFGDFATAGLTSAVLENKAGYDTAIAKAMKSKGSSLALPEVQTQIGLVNAAAVNTALEAINDGSDVFANFAAAGLKNAVLDFKEGYDTAIAKAIKTKGSNLTLKEIQANIDSINAAAKRALAAINDGLNLFFTDFATAGVKNAVISNRIGYQSAIDDAINTKKSSLTLAEVQAQIDAVNLAAPQTALAAINDGSDVFCDFETAGVTSAVLESIDAYHSAIATAVKTKGSSLTLTEVQAQIDLVNTAVSSAAIVASLKAINEGTESFSDFETAGVTSAVPENLDTYHTAIAAAINAKHYGLTLAEVQAQINIVNSAAPH